MDWDNSASSSATTVIIAVVASVVGVIAIVFGVYWFGYATSGGFSTLPPTTIMSSERAIELKYIKFEDEAEVITSL